MKTLLALTLALLASNAPSTASGGDPSEHGRPSSQEPVLRPRESLVDYLASKKRPNDMEARGALWKLHFPGDKSPYKGTAIQNMRLLEFLLLADRSAILPESCRLIGDLATATEGSKVLSIDGRSACIPADTDGFFIIFSARPLEVTKGTAGHAWVSFGLSENNVPAACVARTFGAFPNADAGLGFGPVPGDLVEGWAKNLDDSKETHRLVVRVTSQQYVTARAILESWSMQKTYELIERDSVRFAKEVAQAIGLKTNDRRLPHQFLNKLIEDNRPPRK
jgi:hypothetical protein